MNQVPPMDVSNISEVFSDVFETHINPFSCAVAFGLRATKEGESTVMTHRVRMPLQQAKALAVILLRAVRTYEAQTNVEIELPADLLQALNIPLEDWKRLSLE